jgi:hypothetical protein
MEMDIHTGTELKNRAESGLEGWAKGLEGFFTFNL